MRLTQASWLTEPGIVSLFQQFESAGKKLFAVGGCVRNAVMNLPITDIDLSTDALPEETLNLCKSAGFKTIPTGIDHGTITATVAGNPYEITSFRKDVATDGRRAVVAFASDMAEDAMRRDFTMNALYVDASGLVHDPLGGLTDALDHRIKFIGNAANRIKEDYLRILRFFRFYAEYGRAENGIDADGLAACSALADGLEQISRERIGAEVSKIMKANDPMPALAAMDHSGVLRQILPGANLAALGPYDHLTQSTGFTPAPLARLASLGEFDWYDFLRLPKRDSKQATALRQAATGTSPAATLGYQMGYSDACHALFLRAALLETPLNAGDLERADFGSKQVFPLRAADFKETGPALGRAMRDAEAHWIETGFALSKGDILQWVRER